MKQNKLGPIPKCIEFALRKLVRIEIREAPVTISDGQETKLGLWNGWIENLWIQNCGIVGVGQYKFIKRAILVQIALHKGDTGSCSRCNKFSLLSFLFLFGRCCLIFRPPKLISY